MLDLIIFRILFVILLALCAWFLRPFQLEPAFAASMGILIGAAIILFELRLKQISLNHCIIRSFLGRTNVIRIPSCL